MTYNFTTIHKITFGISLVCLGFILYSVDWMLMNNLKHLLQPFPIIAASLVFLIFQVAKVIRFTALIDNSMLPRFSTLYFVMNKHAFYLSVLPARMGDLYYSSLLKQYSSIPHSIGNISLYVARIYDILVLSIFTLTGILLTIHSIPDSVYIILLIMIIITLILLINLINTLRLFQLMLTGLNKKNKILLFDNINSQIEKIIHEIQKQHGLKTHFVILIATLINWMGAIIIFWLILNMFQLNLNVIQIAFVVGIVNLFSLMPIQTVGGFGVREAGLLSALAFIGYTYQESSTYAILSRLIIYLTQLVTSILIMMILSKSLKIVVKNK